MDGYPELKSVICSFDDSVQLKEFGDFMGIRNESYVKQTLFLRRKRELEKALDLPSYNTNEPLFQNQYKNVQALRV